MPTNDGAELVALRAQHEAMLDFLEGMHPGVRGRIKDGALAKLDELVLQRDPFVKDAIEIVQLSSVEHTDVMTATLEGQACARLALWWVYALLDQLGALNPKSQPLRFAKGEVWSDVYRAIHKARRETPSPLFDEMLRIHTSMVDIESMKRRTAEIDLES